MAIRHAHPETETPIDSHILARTVKRIPSLPGKLFAPDGWQWDSIARVTVLVPDDGLRVDRLVRVLNLLQIPDQTEIALVNLATTKGKNRAIRRRMDALVAHLREAYPVAYGRITTDTNWRVALRLLVGRDDLLICLAKQRETIGMFRSEPLSKALFQTLHVPVFEIAGAYPPWTDRLLKALGRLLFNLLPFAVVGIFLWLQIQVGSQTSGLVGKVVLALTVIVELALIFIWSLFLDS